MIEVVPRHRTDSPPKPAPPLAMPTRPNKNGNIAEIRRIWYSKDIVRLLLGVMTSTAPEVVPEVGSVFRAGFACSNILSCSCQLALL